METLPEIDHLNRNDIVSPDTTLYNQRLAALYAISTILGSRNNETEALREIVALLENICAMRHGTILLLSADKRELEIEIALDAPSAARAEVRYAWGEGVTGKVVETGQSAIIPSISNEPLFRDRIYRRRETREADCGFICVPILIENKVIGTLSVDVAAVAVSTQLIYEERFLRIVSSMIAHDVNRRRIGNVQRELLERENSELRNRLEAAVRPAGMVGQSPVMELIYQRIMQVAQSDTTVLIRGESGTGKELVAAAIHAASPRASGPFVKVNCAALSENLIESELFGHEKGAFTGALSTRIGRFEEASGGTLFLDEIGDIPASTQIRLLRVLQEKTFERIGSNRALVTNVRLLTATNRNLEEAVRAGQFRQDLYYRINVFPIDLPPLRDRRDDIVPLTNHFMEKYSKIMQKPVHKITDTALQMILSHPWPGNVRELENCIEYAIVLCTDGIIHSHYLPPAFKLPSEAGGSQAKKLKTRVRIVERECVLEALKETNGNVTAAAELLGLSLRMVHYKINDLGIDTTQFRKSIK